jgi:hypothetical protein
MGYLPKGTAASVVSSTFSSTLGTLLSPHASLNTKGVYNTVLTTTHATRFLLIELKPAGVAAQQALVDIAYTAGGSEYNVIEDLGVNSSTGPAAITIPLAVAIPAGAVIKARYARTNASLTMRCSIKAFAGQGLAAPSSIATYGAVSGDSGGTSVDPGGTINTKAATWTEVTAATTHRIESMLVHIGNQANATRTDATYLLDIGVGASTFETVKVPDLTFTIDDTDDNPYPSYIGPFPISIPVGTRLSVRGQSTINDATDRLFDVILYGIS